MTRRLLSIAFRNLFRARRRNALAGGSMALGTAALVIASSLADGITRQLSDNLVAVQTGHLQVVVRPDDFQSQNNPFDAYGQDRLPDAEALARRIEAEGRGAGVVRAAAYLFVRGSALASSRSSVAWIVGIDPAREPELRAAQPTLIAAAVTRARLLAVPGSSTPTISAQTSPSATLTLVLSPPTGWVRKNRAKARTGSGGWLLLLP